MMVSVLISLHNLLTKQAVDREVAAHLLKCLENGEHVYHSYRAERLIEKSQKNQCNHFKEETSHVHRLSKRDTTIIKSNSEGEESHIIQRCGGGTKEHGHC